MTDEIIGRITRELGIPNLVELLKGLAPSDLYSLLLTVHKTRVAGVTSKDLTGNNAATAPCNLDVRKLRQLEDLAFTQADQFEAIELSPVCPLGTTAFLGELDLGNVLGTLRSLEVASDPTSALAVECAIRRRELAARELSNRLCTSMRVLRFPLPKTPGYTAHFKLFSMVSAGRNVGSSSFELLELARHIHIYLRFLSHCTREADLSIKNIEVKVCDPEVMIELVTASGISSEEIRSKVRAGDHESSARLLDEHATSWPRFIQDPERELKGIQLSDRSKTKLRNLKSLVTDKLKSTHSNVSFRIDLQRLTGVHYYSGPCFHIGIENAEGTKFMIADGGGTNWMQKLLNDNKERLMTSAIGIELLCRLFPIKNPD